MGQAGLSQHCGRLKTVLKAAWELSLQVVTRGIDMCFLGFLVRVFLVFFEFLSIRTSTITTNFVSNQVFAVRADRGFETCVLV